MTFPSQKRIDVSARLLTALTLFTVAITPARHNLHLSISTNVPNIRNHYSRDCSASYKCLRNLQHTADCPKSITTTSFAKFISPTPMVASRIPPRSTHCTHHALEPHGQSNTELSQQTSNRTASAQQRYRDRKECFDWMPARIVVEIEQ